GLEQACGRFRRSDTAGRTRPPHGGAVDWCGSRRASPEEHHRPTRTRRAGGYPRRPDRNDDPVGGWRPAGVGPRAGTHASAHHPHARGPGPGAQPPWRARHRRRGRHLGLHGAGRHGPVDAGVARRHPGSGRDDADRHRGPPYRRRLALRGEPPGRDPQRGRGRRRAADRGPDPRRRAVHHAHAAHL
ncbi:MAG: hypothetical protein AVDCRST_MAG49-1493, partial [uncultured Thermomicrobiales bacterium]